MKHFSDHDLILGINQSDYTAFDELYARYWEILLKIAIKKTGNTDNAMDAVQDLFVDIWQKREVVVVQKSVQAYLVSSIYFKVFMQFREHGLEKRHVSDYSLFLEQTAQEEPVTAAEYETEYENLMATITDVTYRMPERMKEIFNLKFRNALSNREIADTLGISIQTVKNQLTKALHMLRQSLTERQLDTVLFTLFISWILW